MHPTEQQTCGRDNCTGEKEPEHNAVLGKGKSATGARDSSVDGGKTDNRDGDGKEETANDHKVTADTVEPKHAEIHRKRAAKAASSENQRSPVPQPDPPRRSKHTSILKPGATFSGYQESGRQRYEVQVKLLEVDLNSSTLSGFLTIHNLTDAHPLMVTFFKGEVVGPHFSFETKHASWGSSLRNDIQHWARFTPWRLLDIDISNDAENWDYYHNKALQNEYLFMRWKELFLYPDSNISGVKGASFAGFYYLSFNQISGNITGLYFHRSSDMFQQLNLSFVPDAGVSATYEYA